jgi:hypothetical protein
MPRKKNSPATPDLYSVHPSIAYGRAILDNLPKTTGKSLAQWIRLAKAEGPSGDKERRDWLKKTHKIGSTTARMIAEQAAGKNSEDPQEYLRAAPGYVNAMYAGAKEHLRPIHDKLIELARALGDDVKVCPCQTIVPLYRRHVFGQIAPTTRTRIDLGLALAHAKKKLPARLIDTGGLAKKDRITHRFPIAALEDIDTQVVDWLGYAYELDG